MLMIVKGSQARGSAHPAITRAELREQLIELWAQIFERELRAELENAAPGAADRAVAPRDAEVVREH